MQGDILETASMDIAETMNRKIVIFGSIGIMLGLTIIFLGFRKVQTVFSCILL